jgi:sulfhydrogenase subunit beta (sulfur reductase)
MAAEQIYIGAEHWGLILNTWRQQYTVLAPLAEKRDLFFQPIDSGNTERIVYDRVRAAQPLKSFLLPPLEEVTGRSNPSIRAFLFLGAKACDLKALQILDLAFGGDFADPLYQTRREQSVLVGTDCTDPLDTCCCTWVGGEPYPTVGFDLNLSCVRGGFVLEVGSKKGKALLAGFEGYFKTVPKEKKQSVIQQRKQTSQAVKRKNRAYRLSDKQKQVLIGAWDSGVWSGHSETCVECGACNHACPTCHCYFLDAVTREAFIKLRGWDACQYTGYAVTAGGGSPRPRLVHRFRNRYLCKFDYLDDNYGICGCTGCGRCIEACQGKIDQRTALFELDSGRIRKGTKKK